MLKLLAPPRAERGAGLGAGHSGDPPASPLLWGRPAGAQLDCLFTWGGQGSVRGRPGEAESRQVPSVIAFGHLKGIV